MRNFLQTEFYHNTVTCYLSVLLFILLAVLFKRYISKYFVSLLYKIISKTGKKLNKLAFIELLLEPLENFLLLFVSFVALDKITFPKELDVLIYRVTLFQVIDSATSCALIITFIWLCLRAIDFIAIILEENAAKTNDQSESQLIIFFKDFFKMILVIIGFLLVLRFGFNKDIGNLVTGLSIVGAAIALATKESLENLIASFIIFFDKPFTIGDTVKVNNLTGMIERIGLRSTRIRTEEKTYISVPNKQMVDSIVDNLSLRTFRKVILHFEISLSTKATQLQELINGIKDILDKDLNIKNASVFLKETGKNAHIIEGEYYTEMIQTLEEFTKLREQVYLDVIILMEKKDIVLAATNSDVVVINK